MLSLQRGVTDKSIHLLESLRDGKLETGKVYLSGHGSYSHYEERTDTAGKFPILGRFPEQHNATRTSGSEDVIDILSMSLTYAPSPWVAVYVNGIYTDIEFPRQEEAQIREGFVTIGNLQESPFYAAAGKKTVNFGRMDAYNPTTHTVTNHFYRTDMRDMVLELGYVSDDWHFTISAMEGGRQLRVADSTNDDFLGNFALTAQRNFECGDWDISVGAGYLNSSIYDSDSANHPGVAPDPLTMRHRNGVYDVWVEAKNGPWSFLAEYTKTERAWPATGRAVEAISLQAAYDTTIWDRPTRLSASWGRGEQGRATDPYYELTQLAVGAEMWVTPNFSMSAEYVYNTGFVPLIMISRASDPGVDTGTLILSGRVFF